MKKYQAIILTSLCSLLITGCSIKNEQTVKLQKTNQITTQQITTIEDNKLTKDLKDGININDELVAFYKEWRGVKYRFGGTTKRGIDCSAFIQRAYKEKFNIKIPRTTWYQVKVGKTIKRSELEIGDLVFFKTGKNSRHVGIYMENGNFMHSSTKRGVIISNLSNRYYNKHYWTAKRIIY